MRHRFVTGGRALAAVLALATAGIATGSAAGPAPDDTLVSDIRDEIVVTASRYGQNVHLNITNITRDQLQQRLDTDDIPLLLEDVPGVYASTDAGNGIGYTYLNIRGFDQKRVGVMINGIPLNDPEDHQVYWVDLPDLASSLQDIQVQRGITNSVGATTAIGGTVNLLTETPSRTAGGRASFLAGSYDTWKGSLALDSGLLGDHVSSSIRYSRIETDGYRDRSGSELWGLFWSGRWEGDRSSVQVNVYTGHEIAHQAWYGIPENLLETDRTANPETYPDAIDDFRQPHYELHHRWEISDRVVLEQAAYWIHGYGFYENRKDGRDVEDFGLDLALGLDPETYADGVDLIRRKYVRKDQLGWVPHLEIRHRGGRLIVGGDVYDFDSDHWGDVLGVLDVPQYRTLPGGLKYYGYDGDKTAWSTYVNEMWEVLPGLTLLADLQFQHKDYTFRQEAVGHFTGENRHAYSVDYDFFNPKGGVSWELPSRPLGGRMALFGHVGVTHREPTDAELFDTWDGPDDLGVAPLFRRSVPIDEDGDGQVDYLQWSDPYVSEEKAVDYEVGLSWRGRRLSWTLGGYWMNFDDEIVPYGAIDDDGRSIRGNAGRTWHRGLELGLAALLSDDHTLKIAASRSWNEFRDFTATFDPNAWEMGLYDYRGNPIPLFPEYLLSAALESRFGPVASTVRVRSVGKQYLDVTGNEERTIDAYTTVDVRLAVDLRRAGLDLPGDAVLDVRIRNLLDEEYETSGYYSEWDGGNILIPAAKRNVLAGLRYSF